MIQKQISEHAAFDQKTEFAKEKYIRRKESKWVAGSVHPLLS